MAKTRTRAARSGGRVPHVDKAAEGADSAAFTGRLKRPVLQFRVHEDDYEKLRVSARKHKFTISEEAAHQLNLAFQWDATRVEMQRLTTTLEGVKELMVAHGFKKVPIDQGAMWSEPGVDISRMSVSLDAAAVVKAMEPELANLLARAIEAVKPGSKK